MSEAAAQTTEKKRPKKRRRKIIRKLIVLVIVLGILGFAGFVVVKKLQADYRITYDPYTATVGSITNSLSYSGTMQLVNNKTYTAAADAKVREIYVAEGDKVAEGEKLMRLSDGTTVTADFAGTVNKISVEKGDEVRNNTSLIQIADFDHMQVSFRIGESNIRDVLVGQAVQIKISSINASFESTVKSIDYSTYSGNNVAYYTAVVDVDTSSVDYIYPGMQATISITREEAKDVVILKMDAISTASNNTAFVYMEDEDGNMKEQEITVGISNGNYAEIKAGLNEGDTVYVVKEEEESSFAGILAGLFGNTQVNRPSGAGFGSGSGMPSGFGGGSGMPSSDDFAGSGGGSSVPGNNGGGNGGGSNRPSRGQ